MRTCIDPAPVSPYRGGLSPHPSPTCREVDISTHSAFLRQALEVFDAARVVEHRWKPSAFARYRQQGRDVPSRHLA